VTVAVELPVRVTPRGGLGGLGARLSTQPCTIAYLGASVTAQREGYRPRVHKAIRSRFAQDHRAVNAGVGGVGAVSAAFLMDRLVLRHRPDFCFVEYSSGDMGSTAPPGEIEAAVAGIVGKLRDAGCAPCFLHMYRAGWSSRCAEVVASWERVATRWNVPSIDVATSLVEAIESGLLREDELLRDVIHATPEGSRLVAAIVDRAFAQLAAAAHSVPTKMVPLPSSLDGDDFRTARVIPASAEDAGGEAATRLFRLQMAYVELGAGTPLARVLPGELLGLVVIVGPQSGVIRVRTAGDEQTVMLWDDTCWYERLSTVILDRRCPAGAEVTIELTDEPVDYSQCRRPIEVTGRKSLKLVGYMVLG
jgi:GDSL-like lipase/acylhydrolase family protein